MAKKKRNKRKKRKKRRIRPLALCVFSRDEKIFVAQGYDAHADQIFYRPIGGRIEFGERGREAVAREVYEELRAEASDIVYLGALENIFTFEGRARHEIALIFDGSFQDPALNQDDAAVQGMDDGEILYEGSWKSLDFFRAGGAPPLYPPGLLDMLDAAAQSL